MRILLLSHGLPPESIGGVQQHVLGLAEALIAGGHRVHVFARATLEGTPQGRLGETTGGHPAVTTAAFRWEGTDSLDAMYACEPMGEALRAFLSDREAAGEVFDVAHVHHLTGLSTDAVSVLRDAGLPVVMTLHDYWLFCPRGQMFHKDETVCETAEVERCSPCLQATFPWWLNEQNGEERVTRVHDRARAVLLAADRLVVPSARAVPPFTALGVPAERFTVVENGVDTGPLGELPSPAPHDGPLRLGYLGTLIPSKGLDVAIQALRRLPSGTATLAVHGNKVPYHGDDGYFARCFPATAADDAITYHGEYGLDELPQRLREIDVLLAPALWHEAFGLTVREALAAGRPVLVSRIGGLQDAVVSGEQGLVLPPGDVDAWAEAIAELAADRPRVAAMAEKARTRARSFAEMAEQLVGIYGEAAAR